MSATRSNKELLLAIAKRFKRISIGRESIDRVTSLRIEPRIVPRTGIRRSESSDLGSRYRLPFLFPFRSIPLGLSHSRRIENEQTNDRRLRRFVTRVIFQEERTVFLLEFSKRNKVTKNRINSADSLDTNEKVYIFTAFFS